MLWNRPSIPVCDVPPHSKWSISCAFVGFCGDRSETGNYFQGYFLFLGLILTIWDQRVRDWMLGYYICNMIWASLGQETCKVCICHGRAQLGFSIEEKAVYAHLEGLWSVSLSTGSTGLITFSSPYMVCEPAMQNSVFPNSAFSWRAELSPAPEVGWQVTWMAQELSRGKVSPSLEARYHTVSGFTGEEGGPHLHRLCPCL